MRILSTVLLSLPLVLACGDKDDDTGTAGDGGASDGGASDGGASDGGASDGGANDGGGGDGGTTQEGAYEFASAFGNGSSVSYDGQVMRQLLIDDMKRHLSGLTGRLDGGALFPVEGDVAAELDFYFSFDSDAYGSLDHDWSGDLPATQTTYDEVSTGKDLVGKIAGNDPTGQHVDWSTGLIGWGPKGSHTPEGLVRAWFDRIDAQAVAWSNGDVPLDPTGSPVPAVYVTPQGQDLQQLLEKFLRGAVSFSQGADDYLDDDLEGKGLNSSHAAPTDGLYTELEHQWDEGFGYFGAARTYGDWTDEQIADVAYLDADGDGSIDLLSEVAWGHSTNAAKRDLGASDAAPTDFTAVAWQGFYEGRALLSATAGAELSSADLATLKGHRDQAVMAWEQAIAATVVHYINDLLQDMGDIGTEDYSFADHAKHWSELKGFALSLQFNPRSPLTDAELETLHALLRDAPVLSDAGPTALSGYAADLVEARALIAEAYAFDAANIGDEDGLNGW